MTQIILEGQSLPVTIDRMEIVPKREHEPINRRIAIGHQHPEVHITVVLSPETVMQYEELLTGMAGKGVRVL